MIYINDYYLMLIFIFIYFCIH